jgi:hypothetical protein
MLEPPPTGATVKDAIAAEVEALEGELKRIDVRIRDLGWAGRSRRQTGKLTWSDFALGPPVDSEADRDWTAYEALSGKREQILVRLGQLRERLLSNGV